MRLGCKKPQPWSILKTTLVKKPPWTIEANVLGILKTAKLFPHLFVTPKEAWPHAGTSCSPRLTNAFILLLGGGWRKAVVRGLPCFCQDKVQSPPTKAHLWGFRQMRTFSWVMGKYYITTDNIHSKVFQSCTTHPHCSPLGTFGLLHVRGRWSWRMGYS